MVMQALMLSHLSARISRSDFSALKCRCCCNVLVLHWQFASQHFNTITAYLQLTKTNQYEIYFIMAVFDIAKNRFRCYLLLYNFGIFRNQGAGFHGDALAYWYFSTALLVHLSTPRCRRLSLNMPHNEFAFPLPWPARAAHCVHLAPWLPHPQKCRIIFHNEDQTSRSRHLPSTQTSPKSAALPSRLPARLNFDRTARWPRTFDLNNDGSPLSGFLMRSDRFGDFSRHLSCLRRWRRREPPVNTPSFMLTG